MIDNYNAFSGLIIGIFSFVALCYVAIRQSMEVSKPRDWLTGLRWQIFAILIVAIIGSTPGLVYTYFRAKGIETETLRNIATITGNVSKLANTILLVMVFNYKRRS